MLSFLPHHAHTEADRQRPFPRHITRIDTRKRAHTCAPSQNFTTTRRKNNTAPRTHQPSRSSITILPASLPHLRACLRLPWPRSTSPPLALPFSSPPLRLLRAVAAFFVHSALGVYSVPDRQHPLRRCSLITQPRSLRRFSVRGNVYITCIPAALPPLPRISSVSLPAR